jgi:hypothetical protein
MLFLGFFPNISGDLNFSWLTLENYPGVTSIVRSSPDSAPHDAWHDPRWEQREMITTPLIDRGGTEVFDTTPSPWWPCALERTKTHGLEGRIVRRWSSEGAPVAPSGACRSVGRCRRRLVRPGSAAPRPGAGQGAVEAIAPFYAEDAMRHAALIVAQVLPRERRSLGLGILACINAVGDMLSSLYIRMAPPGGASRLRFWAGRFRRGPRRALVRRPVPQVTVRPASEVIGLSAGSPFPTEGPPYALLRTRREDYARMVSCVCRGWSRVRVRGRI